MTFSRKYIFPPLYGLLIYFTIRLLHDTDIEMQFWKRDWRLNTIEISCSAVVGYIAIYLFAKLFGLFNKKWPVAFNYWGVFRELLIIVFADLMVVNAVFVPMDTALKGAWIPWADLADINMIPTLYAIIYYGIARSNDFLKAYVNNKIQLEKVTNDHLQTELKFLKSQYHPHFLFNALNTIYFQMDDDVQGAKNSIEKFSELLRYQLYDQQQQVAVSSEIDYLQSFIDLQKIRSSERLKLTVNFDKALNTQLVFPLLFLPLVENAFKFIGGNYNMTITAQLQGNSIIFITENSIPSIAHPVTAESGIGLENLRRRLDLLYPQKHIFNTQVTKDNYTAQLTLLL